MEETELTFQDNVHYWILKITQFTEDLRMPVSSFQTSNLEESKPWIHINLPKLHIQPFEDNSLEWLPFRDSFSNAVHYNANISNIDMMNYLKGVITGEAARALSGLPVTSQNCEKAIQILKESYENRVWRFSKHFTKDTNS